MPLPINILDLLKGRVIEHDRIEFKEGWNLDAIQKQTIGFNNLIKPVYSPKLSIEEVDGNQIIVLWVPGGANRQYEVPEQITTKEKRHFYYIRKYSSSGKVITLIRNNSHITASELAISIGISSRAIEKIIGNLKEVRLLERKSSRKTGYWVINSSE